MKTTAILALLLTLHPLCVSAETGSADSDEFPVELGSARTVAAETSTEFPVDLRDKGGVGGTSSAEFALDTTNSGSGWLEASAPAQVASGSVNPVLVTWHYGTNSTRNVTNLARWVFRTDPAGGSYFSGGELHAGVVSVPTSMTVAAVYETIGGISRQSEPVTITVQPGLQGAITATRQGTTGQVTFIATASGGSGSTTVRWNTDNDSDFDDGMGTAITMDYGTATGTMSVAARITDGAGGEIVRRGSITLNKPPVVNQPVVAKSAFDPAGFQLFHADSVNSTFALDASRRNAGLVVIAHGLFSDAKQPWLREMGAAIERRCVAEGKAPPNIALMDWSRDAKDPVPVPPGQQKLIDGIALVSGIVGYKPGVALTSGFNKAQFLADLWGVREFGILHGQLLADWVYRSSRYGATPPVNADSPIHFIGHSAGGFVCGEAARLLKHPLLGISQPVYVDRVTLLDTPFPVRADVALEAAGYPNPGVVDRYVSSYYGMVNLPGTSDRHQWYSENDIFKSIWPLDRADPGESGHGWAYKWFTEKTTDPLGEMLSVGFAWSPIINPATRIPKPYTPPRAALAPRGGPPPAPAPSEYPDIVPGGWETFGNVSEGSGIWTLTELDDAGIWKEMTLPATAATLAFDFHFLTQGDGDFLAVHLGDMPVLYQGLDLPLSRDAWLPAEIPLDLLPQSALAGKLVFTLVSRGGVNAQVQVRNIRITQSADVDGDGLVMTAETTAATDPRDPDTDGDGLADGEETVTYQTDPTRADSDGDGQNDASELAAGTNPLANGSYLRVTAVVKTAQGFSLQWSGVAGKSYRVLRSQELGTGNFDTLAFGVAGVAPFTTHTDPNPPPGRAFYWVEVE